MSKKYSEIFKKAQTYLQTGADNPNDRTYDRQNKYHSCYAILVAQNKKYKQYPSKATEYYTKIFFPDTDSEDSWVTSNLFLLPNDLHEKYINEEKNPSTGAEYIQELRFDLLTLASLIAKDENK